MQTFYSHAFGCRVNQAEKEALDNQLLENGLSFKEENPDVYIINTCSVTHKAEREAKQLIYQIKRRSPDTKIVVTGCAATNWIKQGVKVDEVDLAVDNKNKEYLSEIIKKHFNTPVIPSSGRDQDHIKKVDKYLNSGRAILKIQDGCHRFCTFCIVPYLRGLPKSTPVEDLVKAVNGLDPSIKEVILSAINTQAYGFDTKEPFIKLLHAIMNHTTVERISFGSIHPWSFDEEFFTFYKQHADSERFVHFFHIPLQSGCNKILTLMKRGYTREEFMEKLQRLSTLNPFAYIGTDVIVGFLEETEKDFDDTYDFLEKTPISKFHVFRFSQREHTAAHYLARKLQEPTPAEKQKRAQALISLGKKKYQQFLQKHIGKTFEALLLEQRSGEYQHALLQNQVPIFIKTAKDLRGSIQNIRVGEYKDNELIGTVN